MVENPRAAVVGGGDDGSGTRRSGGGEHGGGDFLRRTKRNRADGGAGTAEKCAEGAGGFGGGDHVVEKRDKFFPERLMKMIDDSAVERLVFARGKGGGDCAGVSGIFHGLQTIDPGRK